MEDSLQLVSLPDSDGLEIQLVGDDEEHLDACFANGLATDNPWPGELVGYDSGDRVVEARGVGTNFYKDIAAFKDNDVPRPELWGGGAFVASSSKHDSSIHLEMVPYVHPEELMVGVLETQENNLADKGENSAESECGGGAGDRLKSDPLAEIKGSTMVGEVLLPTSTWGEKLKGMEETFGYVRGMQDYAGKLENALYKIAVLACQDGMVRGSVGSLIPSEVLEVARKAVLKDARVLDGVKVPEDMNVQFESIGITCHVKYNCALGGLVGASATMTSCMNESCAKNRYPNPSMEDVWNLTSWIVQDATEEDLSLCWHDPAIDGVMALTGLDFKRYIEGNAVGVNMFAAFTNLLRQMETSEYMRQPKLRTIHYVNHQWASMVTSGLLSGNASVQAFYTPKPAYLISACTMVIAPICIHNQWFCYAMDFQNRVVTVMDPNFAINCSMDFVAHHKNANLLLKEIARCMRKLSGNNKVGRGGWRGVITLPKHCGANHHGLRDSMGSLIPCMKGFNGDYVCDTTDEISRSLGKKEDCLQLITVVGEFWRCQWDAEYNGLHSRV